MVSHAPVGWAVAALRRGAALGWQRSTISALRRGHRGSGAVSVALLCCEVCLDRFGTIEVSAHALLKGKVVRAGLQ